MAGRVMDPTPPGGWSFWQFVSYPIFAAVGGLLGYLLRTLDAGLRVSKWRAVIESLGAGFVGEIVLLMCKALGLGWQWTGVMTGVCGWLGATVSIRLLEKVVRKKLGVADETGTVYDHHE
ncbi:MAG: phage holin family protein [Rhodanobacter sp.]